MTKATDPDAFEGLPGAELVRQGLAEFEAGEIGIHALLLAAATTRLRELGVPVPLSAKQIGEPEISLYDALCRSMTEPGDDPYYRYNSLRRELDSFISTLGHRRSWLGRGHAEQA